MHYTCLFLLSTYFKTFDYNDNADTRDQIVYIINRLAHQMHSPNEDVFLAVLDQLTWLLTVHREGRLRLQGGDRWVVGTGVQSMMKPIVSKISAYHQE